jgi:hypothetical protein
MAQYQFGSGQIHTAPVGGGAPLRLGVLQDVSVDFSGDVKQLFGQYQFPVDVARGKTKVEGKAASGQLDLDQYNNMFFGETTTTGQKKVVSNEAGTVPAMSTYTVTVANGATFFMDLGVYVQSTGLPLQQVAASPATGQYTVSTVGVYTFNAAQAGVALYFNYIYTDAATGKSMTITNQLMGNTPKFQLTLSSTYNSKFLVLVLYSCVSEKLSMPFKQDDYEISGIDFQAQANDAGNIGFISVTG